MRCSGAGNAPNPLNCGWGRFCIFTVIYNLLPFRRAILRNAGVILVAALTIAWFAAPTPSYAWGEGGHRIVAFIAYGRLSPRAKAVANKLLQIPLPPLDITRASTDFVSASVWADEVRGNPPYEETGPWHYVDNPFGITPETPLPAGLPEAANIITALKREIVVLRNPAAKQTERATALRFLIHFVGDIHQPLHCATRISPLTPTGDRGGNGYRIHVEGQDKIENLHAYWDSGLEEFPRSPDKVAAVAAQAMQENPASVTGWKAGGVTGFNQWMGESEWLAKNVVYNDLRRGKQPSIAYVRAGHRIVNKRVAWAGYRLAALLNDLFAKG